MSKNENSSESIIRHIKRKTRRKFAADEKIRIVLDGLKGEDTIAAICRREGIHAAQYYTWSKDFLDGGKRRLLGDTKRDANTDDVSEMKDENHHLKQLVADLSLKNDVLKKSLKGIE